jgi:hypothetical protein
VVRMLTRRLLHERDLHWSETKVLLSGLLNALTTPRDLAQRVQLVQLLVLLLPTETSTYSVLCSSFLFSLSIFLSLLIYNCLLAFSGTTWHASNHHPPPSINHQYSHYLLLQYRYGCRRGRLRCVCVHGGVVSWRAGVGQRSLLRMPLRACEGGARA